MPPAISIERLTRRYGRRVGVDALSLSLEPGEVLGFLGPNGAGKTTTIRVLLGFLRPTAGDARVLGLGCWRRSPQLKREVGYLPGDLRVYPWLTARAGLAMAGAARGADLAPAGGELCERLELDADVPARKMSRGMRQKLGLVLALAHRPRVLVLDEPTSGLDPIIQQRLIDILCERAREGAAVFFSSHSLGEVETLCERVAILRRGRLVADERLEDLRARARRSVVVRFDSPPPERAPACLDQARREEKTWTGELNGPAEPLLAWLAEHPPVDVTISPPDLERLFHAYYAEDA